MRTVRRICVTGSLLAVLLASAATSIEAAPVESTTAYSSEQTDQLGSTGPYQTDSNQDTQARVGTGNISVGGDLNTTYQTHSFYSAMGAFTNGAHDVTLAGTRTHALSMSGVRYGPAKWFRSSTLFTGTAKFSDSIMAQPDASGGVPDWIDFIWELDGFYRQELDIDAGEQPLYRLRDTLVFQGDGNGAEETPVNVSVTTYDPAATSQNPPMWGLLSDDVNIPSAAVPGLEGRIEVLSVRVRRDTFGNVLPVDINTALSIETSHEFLNDGNAFNYRLDGNLEYKFQQSADLLGVMLRDSAGGLMSDVNLISAQGVNYTNLIPEPNGLLLLALAGISVLRCTRRKT